MLYDQLERVVEVASLNPRLNFVCVIFRILF